MLARGRCRSGCPAGPAEESNMNIKTLCQTSSHHTIQADLDEVRARCKVMEVGQAVEGEAAHSQAGEGVHGANGRNVLVWRTNHNHASICATAHMSMCTDMYCEHTHPGRCLRAQRGPVLAQDQLVRLQAQLHSATCAAGGAGTRQGSVMV